MVYFEFEYCHETPDGREVILKVNAIYHPAELATRDQPGEDEFIEISHILGDEGDIPQNWAPIIEAAKDHIPEPTEWPQRHFYAGLIDLPYEQ